MLLEKEIPVLVPRGVHGRVAARLAQIAQDNDVRVYILKEGQNIDCSSVLDVLSMAFLCGTLVRFRVCGAEAHQALLEIESLFAERGEP